jgi:formylglycine-generating enzyme required for sulfatase activity
MARPYVFSLLVIGPALAFAGCFPDYQVGDGSQGNGDGGVTGDGTTQDGAGNGDGQSAGDGGDGGGGGDGGNPFDAAASKVVPAGMFVFTDPSGSTMTTATLSHDVYFDTHELTVARLRDWVTAAKPFPCATGTCTLDPGGPYANKIVWNSAWNQNVAAEDYKDANCQAGGISQQGFPTYNGTDDTVPANCLNWYQAVALCWFDGGKRLATQVEWQYEATGRGRGRTYPWGDTPVPVDCSYAIWRSDGGSLDNYDGCGFPIKAGSAPMGASFDGVEDLAGSVAEWTWDWYDNTYPPQWPSDWTGPAEDAGNLFTKMTRGGNWDSPENELHTNQMSTHDPTTALGDVGIRCVKTKL